MSNRFESQHEIDTFLKTTPCNYLPWLKAPTGVPVWFDWDGKMVRMFTSLTSPISTSDLPKTLTFRY